VEPGTDGRARLATDGLALRSWTLRADYRAEYWAITHGEATAAGRYQTVYDLIVEGVPTAQNLPAHQYERRSPGLAVVQEFATQATELPATANQGMGWLVRSGDGVEPEAFYAKAMRLLRLRLHSIGSLPA
jgi:hypothetical protein